MANDYDSIWALAWGGMLISSDYRSTCLQDRSQARDLEEHECLQDRSHARELEENDCGEHALTVEALMVVALVDVEVADHVES